MPGFFARDLSRFPDVMSVWYGDSPMLHAPAEVGFLLLFGSFRLLTVA